MRTLITLLLTLALCLPATARPDADTPANAGKKADQKASEKADQKADAKASEKADQKASEKADQKASAKASAKADQKASEKAGQKADQKADAKADEKADAKADEPAKRGPQAAEEQPAPEPRVVARVDDRTVTDRQVEEHLRRSHGRSWRQWPKATIADARRDVVEQHIRALVIEAELKRRKIEVTRGEIKAKIGEMRRELASKGQDLDTTLRKGNSNLWYLERAMRGTIGLFKIVEQQVGDEQVKAYYEANPVQFQPRWQVRQILQMTVDRVTRLPLPADKLKAARARILQAARALKPDGSNFEALIASHSNGPRAAQGGKLPWYGASSKLPTAFRDAMIALERPGQTSKVIRTKYGYHILQLVATYRPKWQDARQPCIQAVQESLMRSLLEQAQITRYDFETGKKLPDKPAKPRRGR